MTEQTKPVPNFQLSDYEKHQTLPYLWYSGSIEEDEFLNIAFDQLSHFNNYFELDELSNTRFKEQDAKVIFMLSDLQTLGQALVKAFQQPLTKKQLQNGVDQLRLKVSIELA